jgi:biopolymer transport protein ExbB/TolQ
LDYWHLTLATGVYLGSVILAVCSVILAMLGIRTHGKAKVHLAEFAQLRDDVRQLSDDVKQLLYAEERRFLKELTSSKPKEADPPTNAQAEFAMSASKSRTSHDAAA